MIISINKGDYTITSSDFQYFYNTQADKTIVYGPGVLKNNAINVDTEFIIQARNFNNVNRESGADQFKVVIRRDDL